jgi:hypothetical protein
MTQDSPAFIGSENESPAHLGEVHGQSVTNAGLNPQSTDNSRRDHDQQSTDAEGAPTVKELDVRGPGGEGALAGEGGEADAHRRALWEAWKDTVYEYSEGNSKFDDFFNRSATAEAIARGFLQTRLVRPDRPTKDGGLEKHKDGQAISGAVLKDDTPAWRMTDDQRAAVGVKKDKPGKKRKNFCNRNVARVGGVLAYDIDNKDGEKRIDVCRARLIERKTAAVAYSTHSNTAEQEKGRIVVWLKQTIPTDTDEQREIYSRTYDLIGQDLFGKDAAGKPVHDPSCSNPARVIYLPSHNGQTPIWSWFEPGAKLDVTSYLERARRELAGEAEGRHAARNKAPTGTFDVLLPQVRAFIRRYKGRLDLNRFFIEIGWEIRNEGLSDSDIACPFDDDHTNAGDANDTACHVWSPEASNTGAAHVNCEHDHCKKQNKRTCADFVAKAMASKGVELEKLREYVEWTAEELEREDWLLPDGFERGDDGVIYGFAENDERRAVCGDLRLTGMSRTEAGGGWGREIEFGDKDGARKQYIVTNELLYGDGADLFKQLGAAGLWISSGRWARDAFKRLLNTWETDKRITTFSKPGWHGAIYVSPLGEVVGAAEDGTVYRLKDGIGVTDREKEGTYGSWQATVGNQVWQKDTQQLALGLTTGCAGVLVQLIDADTMGLHLSGESTRGKTTAQRVAASCVGNVKPDTGVLVLPRATPNGTEAQLEMANGASLHFDEAKTSDGKLVATLPFFVAGGAGRARLNSDASRKRTRTWSTFVTMSSEQTLRTIMEKAGGEMLTGAAVRMPSVSVESCPKIDKARIDAITAGAKANYGHVLPIFVAEVMKRGLHREPDQLRQMIDSYAKALPGADDTPAATRAAFVFGLLRAVGEIMKAAGIAPADADARGVVEWAWSSFRSTGEAQTLDPAAHNVEILETWLRSNPGKVRRVGDRDGYQEIVAWFDDTTVYLPCDKISAIPGLTLPADALVSALKDRGLLVMEGKNRKHERVPKIGPVRHYRLVLALDPFSDDDDPAAAWARP